MNDSLFEALMIGVYTFIFIIALTAGILLMGKINDLVEYSKNEVTGGSSGALIETDGSSAERTYLGTEVYAIYGQWRRGELKPRMNVNVKIGNSTTNINEYGEKGITYLSEIFLLEIKDENNFTFVLQND